MTEDGRSSSIDLAEKFRLFLESLVDTKASAVGTRLNGRTVLLGHSFRRPRGV